MKTTMMILGLLMTVTVHAAEQSSEMVIEKVEDTTAMSCVCYRGPGQGNPYNCEPVAKTCYGGPGYYPYTCYVCPQSGK